MVSRCSWCPTFWKATRACAQVMQQPAHEMQVLSRGCTTYQGLGIDLHAGIKHTFCTACIVAPWRCACWRWHWLHLSMGAGGSAMLNQPLAAKVEEIASTHGRIICAVFVWEGGHAGQLLDPPGAATAGTHEWPPAASHVRSMAGLGAARTLIYRTRASCLQRKNPR